MRVMLGAILILLFGCTSPSAVYKDAEEKWQKRKDYWMSQMVHFRCDDGKRISTYGRCNTETEKFYSSKPALKKLVCTKGMNRSQCEVALRVVLVENLKQRYPYANWEESYAWCKASPYGCPFEDPELFQQFEVELWSSNNKFVHDEAMAELSQIQNQADSDAIKKRETTALGVIGTILQGAGQGLMHAQDNTYNCTNFGNGTYTCDNQGHTYNCTTFGNTVQCK